MIAQVKLLPLGPTARLLCVPVKWLRSEAEAGRVPCLIADKAILFDPDAVEAVLVERARSGQGAHHEKQPSRPPSAHPALPAD
jgi:hypothetical protein